MHKRKIFLKGMFLLLVTLSLSNCKSKISDFEWCETEPVYGSGLCFWIFSKKTRTVPLSEWRVMQLDMISMSRDHALRLVKELRTVCYQDKIKCVALTKEIENKIRKK